MLWHQQHCLANSPAFRIHRAKTWSLGGGARQYWFAAHTSSAHLHASLLSADAFVDAHAFVHSEPAAALALQNWFAVHMSSPQPHASMFSSDLAP